MATDIATYVTSRRTLLAFVILGCFSLVFGALALAFPHYEWDLFAYLANATHMAGLTPPDGLHAHVYEVVRESVPVSVYEWLVGPDKRDVLLQDPEAFRQTVAFFYDTRVIYTAILAAALKLGIDPVFASYLIPALCAVASIFLLFRLIPDVTPPWSLLVALPFICFACGLMNVARLATPDSLATLTTIALYALLLRGQVSALLVLLPLSVLVRSDLLVLAGFFHLYFLVTQRASRSYVVISGITTVACYLILTKVIFEADAWSSLIGYNFGDKPTHPDTYVFDISFGSYLSYLNEGLLSLSYNPMFFVFCMMCVMGISFYSSRFVFGKVQTSITQRHADLLFLLVSSAGYVALHFLLFPVIWIRFFAAQYSMVAVVVIWTAMMIMAERNYSDREDMDLFTK